jgi:cytochrome c oxidase subunit IV
MSSKTSSNHAVVFSSLVVLCLCSVGITYLHLSVVATNTAIFSVAAVMAGLVVFQYMNLKSEAAVIYWVTIIPLVLFAILVFMLIPDVCHFSIDFLRGL